MGRWIRGVVVEESRTYVWDIPSLSWVPSTGNRASALTASSPTAATVSTGSAQALAANSNRRGLILVNTSNNTIYLAFGATAVVGSGIVLDSGATFRMSPQEFTTAAMNAIASAASSNLAIQEYTA